jgi:hypothetical protein
MLVIGGPCAGTVACVEGPVSSFVIEAKNAVRLREADERVYRVREMRPGTDAPDQRSVWFAVVDGATLESAEQAVLDTLLVIARERGCAGEEHVS